MLTIRMAQLAVFSEGEIRKFENWMFAHLRKFFPKQCAALGEPELRDRIQYGIRRAAHHGITSKRDVCRYIDLMMVFGRDFDTDKRTRWAADILGKRVNPVAKMRTLFSTARIRLKGR